MALAIDDLKELYIDPKTDFGFKYLFGTELNKDLLIGFLNALFHGEHIVREVTYLNSERLGTGVEERRAIFDVYCEGENGEKFIVEMQNAYQQFFKDRSIYYSTFPIREASKSGIWNFELPAVYTVGILNFVFDEDCDSKDYFHHEVKLVDVTQKTVFYDKLTYIYLELPKFNKKEDELETLFEKWVFVLRNLSRLMSRPTALQERIFTRLFEVAEIARFTPEQRLGYEDSLKAYRDINNITDTARAEGLEEGLVKGKKEEALTIARQMKNDVFSTENIVRYTHLSPEEIQRL